MPALLQIEKPSRKRRETVVPRFGSPPMGLPLANHRYPDIKGRHNAHNR